MLTHVQYHIVTHVRPTKLLVHMPHGNPCSQRSKQARSCQLHGDVKFGYTCTYKFKTELR